MKYLDNKKRATVTTGFRVPYVGKQIEFSLIILSQPYTSVLKTNYNTKFGIMFDILFNNKGKGKASLFVYHPKATNVTYN